MRLRFEGTLAGAAFAVVAALGCQDRDRDPILCPGCIDPNPGVGSGGPPGGGGEGGGDAEGEVTLEGVVEVLTSIADPTPFPFTATATVEAETETGGTVSTRYSGTGLFSLEGVASSEAAWVLATPGGDAVLPTLEPVDTSAPNAQGVVRRDLTVLDEDVLLVPYNVLPVPIELDRTRAQLLLVVESDGIGLAGVTVEVAGATTVIYGDGGSFSETSGETDPSGLVLVPNLTAPPWPGRNVRVSLSGEASGVWELRIASGAATAASLGP